MEICKMNYNPKSGKVGMFFIILNGDFIIFTNMMLNISFYVPQRKKKKKHT